jgi:hypothetical protein
LSAGIDNQSSISFWNHSGGAVRHADQPILAKNSRAHVTALQASEVQVFPNANLDSDSLLRTASCQNHHWASGQNAILFAFGLVFLA